MNNSLIQTKNLVKSYLDAKEQLQVLNAVNWQLEINQSVSIQGASGSGKTTFLHLISGLDSPTSGEVLFENKNINQLNDAQKSKLRNKAIGFIYQFHHLIQEFNVFDNIALPIMIKTKLSDQNKAWIEHLLNELGLYAKKNNYPYELSGGQRQRVAIARALVNQPKCIIADEPTGNLDQKNSENISELLVNLQKQNKSALVIATHNNYLANCCEKKYQIQNQNIQLITV